MFENNEKIMLQGFGLGGWLVLEGYMWNCYIEHASTSRMEAAIEYLVGEDKKREFFDLVKTKCSANSNKDTMVVSVRPSELFPL